MCETNSSAQSVDAAYLANCHNFLDNLLNGEDAILFRTIPARLEQQFPELSDVQRKHALRVWLGLPVKE